MTQVVDVRLTLAAAEWLRDLAAQLGRVGEQRDVDAFRALTAAIDGARSVPAARPVALATKGGGR